MIAIIVERLPSNSQGSDITNPLLSSDAQAQQLGRASIEGSFANKFNVSGTCVLSSYMEPGETVQVTDLDKGNYNAVLDTFSLTVNRQSNGDFTATSNVVMERLT